MTHPVISQLKTAMTASAVGCYQQTHRAFLFAPLGMEVRPRPLTSSPTPPTLDTRDAETAERMFCVSG